MNTLTVKIDDETLRALDEVANGRPRSEVLRKALRQYTARQKLEYRRRQVEEYEQTSGETEDMSRLAESDIEESGELLTRAEKQ